jgi:tryptophan-rich sensory protein
MSPAVSAVQIHASFWPEGVLFAFGALILGFTPAALTFTLRENAVQEIAMTDTPAPAWLFIVVWMIIYPCLGIAAWKLVAPRLTGRPEASVSLVLLAAAFLQNLSFWLTDGLRFTAVVDATGVLLSLTTAFAIYTADHTAVVWLIPWLLWMPATLTLKLVTL